MPNPSDDILGLREREKKMVVLVDSSADKQDLPRFRPPKVKALRPAFLRLMIEFTDWLQWREIVRFNLARVFGGE